MKAMPPGSADLQADSTEQVTLDGIVAGDGQGRRTFNRLIWAVAGLAVLAVVAMLLAPLLTRVPLLHAAQRYLSLPSDAKVISLNEKDHGKEATIVFTVPEPKGPGSRIGQIASDAGLPPPMPLPTPRKGAKPVSPSWRLSMGWQTVVSGNKKIGLTYQVKRGYNGELDTLTYDLAHRIYRYSVVKEEPSY